MAVVSRSFSEAGDEGENGHAVLSGQRPLTVCDNGSLVISLATQVHGQ